MAVKIKMEHAPGLLGIRRKFGYELFRNRSHFLKRFLNVKTNEVAPETMGIRFVDGNDREYDVFVSVDDFRNFIIKNGGK